jgi:hypothetical protein
MKSQREIHRDYRARHKAKIAARRKAQYDADPDANRRYMRELRRKQRAANPEKYRAMLWRQRGMPQPLWPMPGACECCGREEKLCLDHCHETGRFRGWLCAYCNRGIGQLGDNLSGALKAVRYLKKAECDLV